MLAGLVPAGSCVRVAGVGGNAAAVGNSGVVQVASTDQVWILPTSKHRQACVLHMPMVCLVVTIKVTKSA